MILFSQSIPLVSVYPQLQYILTLNEKGISSFSSFNKNNDYSTAAVTSIVSRV